MGLDLTLWNDSDKHKRQRVAKRDPPNERVSVRQRLYGLAWSLEMYKRKLTVLIVAGKTRQLKAPGQQPEVIWQTGVGCRMMKWVPLVQG